jgi:hypothetical protein
MKVTILTVTKTFRTYLFNTELKTEEDILQEFTSLLNYGEPMLLDEDSDPRDIETLEIVDQQDD